MKKPKLGSGKRFAKGVANIEKKQGLSEGSAKAIMASAGRKKYGAKKMAAMAKTGKKRSK
jgi:hypothetical protein